MSIKPILFSPPMVRAIIRENDPKTMTRRVARITVNRNDDVPHSICETAELANNMFGACANFTNSKGYYCGAAKMMYQPGDILWVRETWAICEGDYVYRAHEKYTPESQDWAIRELGFNWKPSIFMPKAAARIFLRVTHVRVERLFDSFFAPRVCPMADLQAEGMDIGDCVNCIDDYGEPCCIDTIDEDGTDLYGGECGVLDDVRSEFADLWDKLNAKRNGGIYAWENNPWVWVYTFERCDKPKGWCLQ